MRLMRWRIFCHCPCGPTNLVHFRRLGSGHSSWGVRNRGSFGQRSMRINALFQNAFPFGLVHAQYLAFYAFFPFFLFSVLAFAA